MSRNQTLSLIIFMGLILVAAGLNYIPLNLTGESAVKQDPVPESAAFSQLADQAKGAGTLGEELQGIWQWQDSGNMEQKLILVLQNGRFEMTSFSRHQGQARHARATGQYSIAGHLIQFQVLSGDRYLFSQQSRLIVESLGPKDLLIRNEHNKLIPYSRQAVDEAPVQL